MSVSKAALLLSLLAFVACARQAVPDPAPQPMATEPARLLVMLGRPATDTGLPGYGGQPEQAATERLRRVAAALARDYRLTLESDWPMRAIAVHCFVFQAMPGADLDALERLRHDRRVESAQALQAFHVLASAAPDPYAPLQHNLAELHLAQAQRIARGRGVNIALIDTGLDAAHPDLAGRLAPSHDFTDRPAVRVELHATALAGIIAADADNGIGMRGVAPLARLLPLRACWANQAGQLAASCDSLSLARALDYAIQAQVQIINLSLAGKADTLLARLIDKAMQQGIVVVAAEETPTDFPASLPGVVAVEASEHADALGIVAPGTDILGTAPGGAYDWFSGASFAAAQISGIVALLREREPGLSPAQVTQQLHAALRPAGRAALSGHRWINACAAIAGAACG